jgi:hypothetical protein
MVASKEVAMMYGKVLVILCLLLCGLSLTSLNNALASGEGLAQESQSCLQCHTRDGIVVTFTNNESLSVHVDADMFTTSVHSFLQCSDCHREFSEDVHPKRRFRSVAQYRIKGALICRRCHRNEQIEAKPIHASLLITETKGHAPICTDCHGAHTMMPVAGGTIYASEKKYCMSCHAHEIIMQFQDEAKLSVHVDLSRLDGSVHNKLSCSDCHFGFSSEEHPKRKFRNSRDYSIASSDKCRRCHFDKYSKTIESIHFDMLRKGNTAAPVCTDCHGTHDIMHISQQRVITAKRCRQCHQETYDVYSKSVHGYALLSEAIDDVPVCVDCHTAHDIVNPLTLEWHERIPEMCGKCHGDSLIMGKYGLSSDVMKTYLSDFHGITLGLYKKQREKLMKPAKPIAVCTDCHGTHNIISTRGGDIREVKSNLMKRCQKCHDDISENFPDAWLSHYEPSINKASLVYFINLFFKFFIPITVIGLILQVFLHIWRYSYNR